MPTLEEQARRAAHCARFTSCEECNEHKSCGFCPDTGTCTPGDLFGPYPGTCSGSWEPMQCTLGPRDAAKHDAETRAALQEATKGFAPDGAPIDRRLGDKRAATFHVQRGRCYEVTFRLSRDVDEHHDLRPTAIPRVPFPDGGQPRGVGFDAFLINKFCPQGDGEIDVFLVTDRGKKGTWRARLFSTPIDEAELERQRDRYETAERRARVSTWCRSCIAEWARCRVQGEPRCVASYLTCLAAAKLTPADCERGDTAPLPKPKGPFNEAKLDPGAGGSQRISL